MAMDPELKAKWVAALRSGEYKQGTGVLHNGEGYCCIGVFCEVSADPSWDGEYITGETEEGTITRMDNFLPYDVTQKYKLDKEILGVLWRMNDCRGASFAEIADYIESNL